MTLNDILSYVLFKRQLLCLSSGEIKSRGNGGYVEVFCLSILFPRKKVSSSVSKDISQNVLRLAKIPNTTIKRLRFQHEQVFLIKLLQNQNFKKL